MNNSNTTWINGLTQDYEAQNGLFIQKNSLLTEVYTRITTPYGSYYFDKTLGSYIPIWLNQRILLDSNKVITEIDRAVQIILFEKRAQSIVTMLTAPIAKNAIFYKMLITDNNSQEFEFDSNYISLGTT